MTKIKICGLSRSCDVDFVNQAKPDYCGFIINVPTSKRSVNLKQLCLLRQKLSDNIIPIGVFVNAPIDTIEKIVNQKLISAVQLHGDEDEEYISALKNRVDIGVIKAFSVKTKADIVLANKSFANYLLLDNGRGGTGKMFDWSLVNGVNKPYFMAGGLTPENIGTACDSLHPYAVDLSSGVETNGYKDCNKILTAVAAVRR